MKQWRTDGFARRRSVAAALALLVLVVAVGRPGADNAESPPSVPAGFSRAKLQRVGDYIRNEIATGKIPGAVVLIQQHGQPVYFENFGVRDVATQLPMTPDTIFRLYSMSKPITSVAVMTLVEEGKLRLDDPVSKYLPAFTAIARHEGSMPRQISSIETPTMPNSSSGSQNCRSPSSRERYGITATRPMCSVASLRLYPENRCSGLRRNACSIP